MNSDPNSEIPLEQRFPDMKPMGGTPALFRLNGFGLAMAGKRGFDPNTGTYIKSHVITALWIPIFALGAYRVADSGDGGWYFIGKVAKSSFAKIWNTFLVSAIAMLIAMGFWNSHQNSPEVKTKERLAEARALQDSGEDLEAARIYRKLIIEEMPHGGAAVDGLQEALDAHLQHDSPEEVAKAVRFTAGLPGYQIPIKTIVPTIDSIVLERIKSFSTNQPEETLLLIKAARDLPSPSEELTTIERTLLEKLAKGDSSNPVYASQLAEIYEAEGREDELIPLLKPHQDRLRDLEGARILGQRLLSQGQSVEATALLENYTTPRLKAWRESEKNYNRTVDSIYNAILSELNQNKGSRAFYQNYEKAKTEEDKAQLVDSYIYEKMQKKTGFIRARKSFEEASQITPVIMDLGIAELRVAQSATDQEARKTYLKRAEDRFLSLQQSSGDSDDFKFFLGQVYFWSGRQDEGRKLFDEILTNTKRSYSSLMSLSATLRETGDVAEAIKLTDEAFEKGATPDEKDSAASQRAVMSDDIDEQITWLEKVQSKGLNIQTRLSGTKARKAMEDGQNDIAIKHLKSAAEGWGKLPDSSSTLNNGALVQFQLFGMTGDMSYQEKGSELMERAVKLESNNSIVLSNASDSLATTGLIQILTGKLHPRLIQEGVGLSTLRYYYNSESSRAELLKDLKSNASFTRAIEFLDRAVLLSPNNSSNYSRAFGFHRYLENEKALRSLIQQIEGAQFDHSASIEDLKKTIAGEFDDNGRTYTAQAVEKQKAIIAELNDKKARRRAELTLSDLQISGFSRGDSIDYPQEISKIRQLVSEDNSITFHRTLVTALSQNACHELGEANAEFKTFLERNRRLLSAKQILILALTSETLRPLVLGSATAKEALNTALESSVQFPSTVEAEHVLMVQYLRPDQLADAKSAFTSNVFNELDQKLIDFLSPWNPGTMVSSYFLETVRGNSSEATKMLEKAKASGLSFPN